MTTSVVLQIIRSTVDNLIVLYEKEHIDSYGRNTNKSGDGFELALEEDHDDVDWMMKVLQSELFSKLPTANIQTLFALLEPLKLRAGDKVIRQGDPGEHYYIVQEGQCQVSRMPRPDAMDIKLAVLNPGDGFGEEALLLDTTRNATVSMITDGIVMQLNKDDFIELVKKPTIQTINYNDALSLVEKGNGHWLDVRFENEHCESSIEGNLNIPLSSLRFKANKLTRDIQYIIYCDTGGRSLNAAFILTTMGFDVCYLDGGLLKNPQAATTRKAADKPQKALIQKKVASNHSEQAKYSEDIKSYFPSLNINIQDIKVDAIDDFTVEDSDPDIKLSILDADLAETDMRLLDTGKIINASSDEKIKATQIELGQRLIEERKKIQDAKKAAEQEVRLVREFEETKIINMKLEVEKELQEERKKLEDVYKRNAEELENIQNLKKETAEKIKLEKRRLEKAAAVANRKLKEAKRIKEEIEFSKCELLNTELSKQKQQEEMEKRIQEQVKLKLKEERRKLAEKLAKHQHELDEAMLDKASAEAARKAAKKEAVQIIAKYKAKHDQDRAKAEQQIIMERRILEQQKTKIQRTLQEIELIKKEAKLAKHKAIEETKILKAERKSIELENTMDRNTFMKALKFAEDKVHKANKEIAHVEQKQVKVNAARKINKKDLQIQKTQEDDVNQPLQSDLKCFSEHLNEKEKLYNGMHSHQEHMKRINKIAKQSRIAAQQTDICLLDEIQGQLNNNRL